MWDFIKAKYLYLHATFHDSEVIAWSRFQILVSSLWLGLQGVDVTPLVKDPRWLMYYIIFSNVVNEMLRRRNAEWKDPK